MQILDVLVTLKGLENVLLPSLPDGLELRIVSVDKADHPNLLNIRLVTNSKRLIGDHFADSIKEDLQSLVDVLSANKPPVDLENTHIIGKC